MRPEANIQTNLQDGLDLYKVIFEDESDSEKGMDKVDSTSVQSNTLTRQEVSCNLTYFEILVDVK